MASDNRDKETSPDPLFAALSFALAILLYCAYVEIDELQKELVEVNCQYDFCADMLSDSGLVK